MSGEDKKRQNMAFLVSGSREEEKVHRSDVAY
jgi:hypothetical protein